MKKIKLDLLYFWRKLVNDIMVSKKGEVFGIIKIQEQNFVVNIIPIGSDIHIPTKNSLRGPTVSEFNTIIEFFWCFFYKEKNNFFSQPTEFTYNFFIAETERDKNFIISKKIKESSEMQSDEIDSFKKFLFIKETVLKENVLKPKFYQILIEPL